MYGKKYNNTCRAPSLALKATWFYQNNGIQSHVDDCQTIINSNRTGELTFCQKSGTDRENFYTTTLSSEAASFNDARYYYCKDSDGEYIKTINPEVISEY